MILKKEQKTLSNMPVSQKYESQCEGFSVESGTYFHPQVGICTLYTTKSGIIAAQ